MDVWTIEHVLSLYQEILESLYELIASSERIKPVILAVDDCIFSCWWFTCRSGSGLPGVPWGAVPITIPEYVGGSVLRHAFYGRVR